MAMREANIIMSPCEVIRYINDEIQDDTAKDIRIRRLLYKLLKMNKAMSDEIDKFNSRYSLIWQEQNKEYDERFKKRITKGYKVDKP